MLLRWRLEDGGLIADWKADLAEEEPDAAAHFAANPPPQKPEEAFVPAGAEFAWAAFWRLHGDRPHIIEGSVIAAGMGGATLIEPRPGRIPFGAIDRYARRFGIDGSAFDLLLRFVDVLDDEFLAWESERARQRAAARG